MFHRMHALCLGCLSLNGHSSGLAEYFKRGRYAFQTGMVAGDMMVGPRGVRPPIYIYIMLCCMTFTVYPYSVVDMFHVFSETTPLIFGPPATIENMWAQVHHPLPPQWRHIRVNFRDLRPLLEIHSVLVGKMSVGLGKIPSSGICKSFYSRFLHYFFTNISPPPFVKDYQFK